MISSQLNTLGLCSDKTKMYDGHFVTFCIDLTIKNKQIQMSRIIDKENNHNLVMLVKYSPHDVMVNDNKAFNVPRPSQQDLKSFRSTVTLCL